MPSDIPKEYPLMLELPDPNAGATAMSKAQARRAAAALRKQAAMARREAIRRAKFGFDQNALHYANWNSGVFGLGDLGKKPPRRRRRTTPISSSEFFPPQPGGGTMVFPHGSSEGVVSYAPADIYKKTHGQAGLGQLAADIATTLSTALTSGTQAFKDIWTTVKGTPKQPTPKPSPAPQPENTWVPVALVGAAAVGAFLIVRSMKKKGRK